MACRHVCSGVTVADVEITCLWIFGSKTLNEITGSGTTLKRRLHTYLGRVCPTYVGPPIWSRFNLDLLGQESGWLMTFLSPKFISMMSL